MNVYGVKFPYVVSDRTEYILGFARTLGVVKFQWQDGELQGFHPNAKSTDKDGAVIRLKPLPDDADLIRPYAAEIGPEIVPLLASDPEYVADLVHGWFHEVEDTLRAIRQ
ncbi:hypothetical protein [Terriglobus roseus]|uniref:Uncharacterized protein n=1 Tax=Terriglobus roseus TaxID=392734 RepID=A0A1G7G5F0_9BACT|nr:hypothetical protein [Terriglobus roseus]SDE83327.1 hypothetical protein SAMN05444167_0558 [Terriglobus roseus]